MENNIRVSDLQQHVGQEITSFYLVTEKELREGKNDHYLRMRLSDRSGSVSANIWNNAKKRRKTLIREM
jgi:3'-5' exoribonuclease